jgi:membrane associated rhomboid family serine protease
MMAIRTELTSQWRIGGTLVRLILVNVAVFLTMLVVDLVLLFVMQDKGRAADAGHTYMRQWIECPQDLRLLITRPWTVVTYMFAHSGIGHIFFNMLMLWFSGQLFQNILGDRRLLGTYILGGFSGLLLYLLFYNLMPMYAGGSWIVGASASVMAILVCIAAYRPQMVVHLLLFGPVKLMYVAGVLLVMDLVFLRDGDNSGGHIAHLGGALYGFLAARGLDRGRDWSMAFANGLERITDFVTRRKKARMRVVTPARRRVTVDADQGAPRTDKQARVDAILDKISRSGYDSLSKEERDFLFKASKDK